MLLAGYTLINTTRYFSFRHQQPHIKSIPSNTKKEQNKKNILHTSHNQAKGHDNYKSKCTTYIHTNPHPPKRPCNPPNREIDRAYESLRTQRHRSLAFHPAQTSAQKICVQQSIYDVLSSEPPVNIHVHIYAQRWCHGHVPVIDLGQ